MAVPPTVAATATAPASLYVGDLHPDVTDGALFEAFTEFKSLSSVRVCRDSSSGRSLCYGYVNFLSPQDAMNAIESKNHTLLNGKFIRVAWSCRDPDARRTGKGNIFVKNLSDSVDNVGLQELFKPFGNILSCKVVTSEDGKSKGYGFVQFDSDESATAAMEKLNGSDAGGKQIYVAKFVKRSDRVLSRANAIYTNLYVKNLDPDVTEEVLREKFSDFGKITSLVIVKNENGISRGFGFVNFESPDDAKQATETMNGSQLGLKVLYVSRAQKRAERDEILRRQFEEKRKESILKYKDSNVYVKNIDDDVSDEELREHFSQCGSITSAKIMRDDKGISKGFGFICFSHPEEASRAVNSFHGFMFHRKPLYVAIAQRKQDRQAQLQLHYSQRMAGLSGASPAVIPGGYPSYYYTGPSGLISQAPSRPGLIHNRGRMNGHMIPQGGAPSAMYIPHLQQPTQPVAPLKDPHLQRVGQHRYVPSGRSREMNKGSGVVPSGSDPAGAGPPGTEMLSSLLAAASPEQQKQILGERLYPLVQKNKPDLVAKITGMLLEMDNSELLLLLESPESLAAKVEEAVQVLKLSKSKSSNQAALQPNFLSTEVAVN
ncbi:hypothetical protein CRG98_007078 [Punica granatum]|uniref:Polyadenylate-binding protein n=1 Tax=Punica granatum TaxID=22663 RepID=A0A2I0KXK6_PUNGR|nr:hypothetical protein CRG98_007078 [Punica granatum]